ncbi:Crp/Fnr family transcriptional regulator [Clostridium omnivorum]|uniref:Crp/Fnr family transcriptional regulator n=1 Tax=Clostridium omnivorum TaxID=1604902 RepID=A0ABQ5N2X0_9CLOT|nr:Crp/Fnr family transcriptional regulator [Clostridium sp. E14]GLC29539.1 Crp/Fnr family transcriptional regulator [Clostridium sp. E14]
MQCHEHSHNYDGKQKSCLEKVPIFSSLTVAEMVEVSMTATHKKYKKGENIYLEGEIAEKLFVINAGKVKISKLSEEGKEQIIRILQAGDFMGELSIFTNSPLKNNAEAVEATTVCTIDSKKIKELIEERPGIAIKILKELSMRLEKTESLIESLGLRDVEQRVADILIKLMNEDNVVDLSISKKDLAAHIGMSQETLSRKLTNFQEKGFIRQQGQRKIIILNKEALQDIVNI